MEDLVAKIYAVEEEYGDDNKTSLIGDLLLGDDPDASCIGGGHVSSQLGASS